MYYIQIGEQPATLREVKIRSSKKYKCEVQFSGIMAQTWYSNNVIVNK